MQRWPQLRRPAMFAGSIVLVISLVAASFCNSVSGLLATQGVLYAIGGMVVYFPTIQYIEEWFVARRGMAYGVMVSILFLVISTRTSTDSFP
jgi:MFS family permease